ncbi:MAG TPA: PLU-1-like domain protein [Leptospiraceae bacterium]|nr:PLU-1-like domain protein [Leptospiraceae bacterium]HMW03711.1 PLU-1-like domain protein [Leptospiraceae bacterium]HMY29691.1 PLU-1-like domain protein [Leptospiraceae bacterium]HMZ64033.1 PLU-1-like domain protein [Leptospiraceae bacterium]HNA07938.1 PLU-1-like domain protein [Leptospiraceae bacterium]
MDFPDLESYFQVLTDTTDNIAIINTHYEADHDRDFKQLEDIFSDIISRPWEHSPDDYYVLFTSYFTFHVKIIEEIIKEAREILNPEKRDYLKKLVNYKKEADEWFQALKKKRKSVMVAA